MIWILTLGIISFFLLLAGSVGVAVNLRRYRRRSEGRRVRAMAEMMKVADQAGEKQDLAPRTRNNYQDQV